MAKVVLQIPSRIMDDLAPGSETGMDFYIAVTPRGLVAILENADALPLYPDQTYYDLNDLLQGVQIPSQRQSPIQFGFQSVFPSRAAAVAALLALPTSTKYVSGTGAIPLINQYTLAVDTMFLRYISSTTDHRYNATTGELWPGTYLTSKLDSNHADTGFGSVGRFALPLPIPITTVIEYTLPKGTVIDAGTVAPNFGQAGGGVEICLTANTSVTVGTTTTLPPY